MRGKKRVTSRNVGFGAVGDQYSASNQHKFHKRPNLSYFLGMCPWKSPVLRIRYFKTSYHRGAARSKKPAR